ncbi:MAG: MlaD family protein [Prevotella sp.]|jgi:phospholipid/cholesterol/gamma-HCH transport system substrate-binding protein|nr:MlaD family protein [Prevotella sp.]
MKFFRKEVQIALVAIVGIIVLFFGLSYLKGLSLFSNSNTYYIKFTDISGLSASSPVYARGYRVGVVKNIIYDFEKASDILAVVQMDDRMNMPEGTSAMLESDMLGNIKINLVFPETISGMMAKGDTIQGNVSSGALAKAAEMIPAIEQLLPKIDSILVSLNTLLADPAIPNSLHHIDQVTGDLTTTTRQLNTMMAQLNHEVPGMMTKANTILDNTTELTDKINQLDFAATKAKVDATLDDVHQMTAALNSDQSSLGLLMKDPGLYNNLNATMMSADSLLMDLRYHPKRYVHFSIFGRK